MALLFDKNPSIASPALAPGQDEFERAGPTELTIGLINNMPDTALKATERQFLRLLRTAAGDTQTRFHCFSLPSVIRSSSAQRHVDQDYTDFAELDHLRVDGLIVTGAEPNAPSLPEEPFWRELTAIVDWAQSHTRSTIFSYLAAPAAVLHLDGIERQRLGAKCSGVYDCVKLTDDWLTRELPANIEVAHSRSNTLNESRLAAHGYQVLTRSEQAGVDIFSHQHKSHLIFFQGHPEYDAWPLQREYTRDLARFLSRERDDYPAIPAGYFDSVIERLLAVFEPRARAVRDPMLAAELPGLILRPDIPAGGAATMIFRNWLDFLGEEARASQTAAW